MVATAPSADSADLLRPTQCRTPIRLAGYTADRHTGEIRPVREVAVRCGSWSCVGCGRLLRRLHLELIRSGIGHHRQQGRSTRLLTLTFPTDTGARYDNPDDVARCTALVTRLIQEIRRTHRPRAEYYAVKEVTARGRIHIHVLITGPYLRRCSPRRLTGPCTAPQCRHGSPGAPCRVACHRAGGCAASGRRPCLQAIAHRLGFGWIDVRKIHNTGGAASYAAKYLSKQVGTQWPRYSRRATYSRGRLCCPDHPDNTTGRRCCPQAQPRTCFAPVTITELRARVARRALYIALALGHVTPQDLALSAAIDIWQYRGRADPPRAPPRALPAPPSPEAQWMRAHNARTEARIRAAGLNPDNPLHGEAIRNLLATGSRN